MLRTVRLKSLRLEVATATIDVKLDLAGRAEQ